MLCTTKAVPAATCSFVVRTLATATPVDASKKTEKKASVWTPFQKRTGLIGVKIGMTQRWDAFGAKVPLTVIQIADNVVVKHQTEAENGYTAIQLGATPAKEKHVSKAMLGHFKKTGVPPRRKLWEFQVTPEAVVPVGTTLNAGHFIAGQYVNVCGTSKGKGFAGAMKRWGFGGQPASHGVSVTHRSHGATGSRQDPGKVFKGKKMAGRLGGERVTVLRLYMFRVDRENNLLFVKGGVPGSRGTYLRITDARARFPSVPPFPTYTHKTGDAPIVEAPPERPEDPFADPQTKEEDMDDAAARAAADGGAPAAAAPKAPKPAKAAAPKAAAPAAAKGGKK